MLCAMDSLATHADPGDARLPDDLVEAGLYRSAQEALEHGLVVLATGRSCWIVPEAGIHRLLVEPAGLAHVLDQLERFDRESIGWPPLPAVLPATHRLDLITPMLWAGIVMAVFSRQHLHPEWMDWGALDAGAVITRGEWWRILTALFLHADAAHVLSNVLGGLLVFSALITTLGRARAWWWLAVASLWANAITVTINHSLPYRSVGASTAVFAALGLLAGRAAGIVARERRGRSWHRMLLPLASGSVVLALYGAGGLRVDVGAHLAGFCVGCLIGFILGFGQRLAAAAGVVHTET